MRLVSALLATLLLAACATPPASDLADRRAGPDLTLPPMKNFGEARPAPLTQSRQQLAADFLDLSFLMESGRPLVTFSRFEAPIRVGLQGDRIPATLERDLDQLLRRLRREAGIDIAVAQNERPNLIIETLPRARLQRVVPQAACFVVPNVTSWEAFLRNRRTSKLDWSKVVVRETAAVFLPDDVAPQEVRDCLQEEIAQAIGPLNDLYRLTGSIFNDDNFHTVLTRFDMTMLRITYDDALQPGMTRAQVADRLPAILARLARNSAIRSPSVTTTPASRDWVEAIETALGPGTPARRRARAAQNAVALARNEGPELRAFSSYALGRLTIGSRPDLALASFLNATRLYDSLPGTDLQQAHIAVQLAAFALSAGQGDAALALINRHLPAAMQAQNAALLATLLLMKSEALILQGRPGEAQAVRLDSLGWARYGFGAEADIRARVRDIAAVRTASAKQ